MVQTTMSKQPTFKDIVDLVTGMKTRNVDHIFPDKIVTITNKFTNQGIEEMIIDDEDNVFIKFADGDEIMLPQFGVCI